MANIYVIGAGFSKTVGIATDYEMLETLNPMLPRETHPLGSTTNAIESILAQNFHGHERVSFELFMSTVSALKFTSEFLDTGRKVFEEDETEVRTALRQYMADCVASVDWAKDGLPILEFVKHVNWREDYVLTFNYDLLIEEAAKHLRIEVGDRVIHLHGAIGESELAWPTYTKFASDVTKTPLGPRWRRAFDALREGKNLRQLVFIGYSMPPTDLEAKGLFNYIDWYDRDDVHAYHMENDKAVLNVNAYSYEIVVVNPADVKGNYSFFRKPVTFHERTLAAWMGTLKST